VIYSTIRNLKLTTVSQGFVFFLLLRISNIVNGYTLFNY